MKAKFRKLLLTFIHELRKKNISHKKLEDLRLKIDNYADNPKLDVDTLIKNGVKECTYRCTRVIIHENYLNKNMENRYDKYNVIGQLYSYVDELYDDDEINYSRIGIDKPIILSMTSMNEPIINGIPRNLLKIDGIDWETFVKEENLGYFQSEGLEVMSNLLKNKEYSEDEFNEDMILEAYQNKTYLDLSKKMDELILKK